MRVIRKRGPSPASRKKEFKALALIMAGVGLPLILEFVLLTADTRVDLSDLEPKQALPAQATPGAEMVSIGWPDLRTPEGNGRLPSRVRMPRVRMLGYMMDGYQAARDGELVGMFILMPEAGQFLHPAHRVPDEMVEVWLESRAPFQERSLVWVSGVLERMPARRGEQSALFAIRHAAVEPAAESDIARWYRP